MRRFAATISGAICRGNVWGWSVGDVRDLSDNDVDLSNVPMTPAEVAWLLERNQVEILAKLGAAWLPRGIYTFIVEESVAGLIRGIRARVVQPDSGQARLIVSLADREWAELERPGAPKKSWTKTAGALRKALSARKPLPWSVPVEGGGPGQPANRFVIEGGIYRSTDGKAGRPRKGAPGEGLGAETGVWLRILHDGKPVDFEGGDPAGARNPLKDSLASKRERLRLFTGALEGFEDALVNLHRAGEHRAADEVVESLRSSNLTVLARRLRRSVAERLARIPHTLLIAILTALLAGGTAVAVYLWVKHMTGRLHRDPQRQGQAVTGRPADLPLIDSRPIDHPRISGRLDIYSKDNREARLHIHAGEGGPTCERHEPRMAVVDQGGRVHPLDSGDRYPRARPHVHASLRGCQLRCRYRSRRVLRG